MTRPSACSVGEDKDIAIGAISAGPTNAAVTLTLLAVLTDGAT